MNERLKLLRKALGLNQEDFAEKVHIAQTTCSQLERGTRKLKDIHIAQICAAFRVNETWLRNGTGEMFLHEDEDVPGLAPQLSMPEICAKLLYAYDNLSSEQQEAVLVYARKLISSIVNDDAFQVAAAIADPSEKGKTLRTAMASRLTQEKSSAPHPNDTETA